MRASGVALVLMMSSCAHPSAPSGATASAVPLPTTLQPPDPLQTAVILAAVRLRQDRAWRPLIPRTPLVPRPAIALSVVVPLASEPGATWPLRRPPTMQPHLPLLVGEYPSCVTSSTTFAARYAAAWCQIRRSRDERKDSAGALAALAQEARDITQTALVEDLAEVLADTASPGEAIARVQAAQLPALRDTLIATYIETGDADAARAVRRAISVVPVRGEPERDCRGVVRDAQLESALVPDRCAALVADTVCRQSLEAIARADESATITSDICAHGIALSVGDQAALHVEIAYHGWPVGRGYWPMWAAVAEHALVARPTLGAIELAESALDNATAVSDCTPKAIIAIRTLAYRLDERTPPELHARLLRLEHFAPSCDMPGEQSDD